MQNSICCATCHTLTPTAAFISCDPWLLQDRESKAGQIVIHVLELCFAMLPRIQLVDIQVRIGRETLLRSVVCPRSRFRLICALCPPPQKAPQLAQLGIPLAERVLLPHIMELTKCLCAGLNWGGAGQEVCRRVSQSLLEMHVLL